jgi:hypothetical protein
LRRSGHGVQLFKKTASIVSIESLRNDSSLVFLMPDGRNNLIDRKEFFIERGQTLKKVSKKNLHFVQIAQQ